MGEHRGDRAHRRRHGVRGAGSGRALEGFRRLDQFQRRRLRVLHLGRRDGRHHQELGGVLDLARADHASGHGGEAGHHHRSHQRRPLHLERGDRLVPARDRNVRRAADRARRALRHGVGMDRDHQAAVDQRGGVRLRRQILPGQEGAQRAAAAAEALSGDHERRRVAEGHGSSPRATPTSISSISTPTTSTA